ncbi:MAG: aconitate hydratase AcnA [Spirochaetaceae bacterium]|nr:MAG: aconitate hydratase AcnA [Spirochaetaceae bacterium]
MSKNSDLNGCERTLSTKSGKLNYYDLKQLEKQGVGKISRMPFSIKILLEAVLRQIDGYAVTEEDLKTLCQWNTPEAKQREFPFKPARVVMQDFTGVPAIVDLAVMRDALADLGGDPQRINPIIPIDLVIDHSVQVDSYATVHALQTNAEMEFKRNRERYEFLRWGASSFENFQVVPPATGIVHQVNLEYLARVVEKRQINGTWTAFPDTLVGTDSHTPMINGIGVLGWGVGGIEAEAAILGQPLYMLVPEVIGYKLTGTLSPGVTATDLVLTVTQSLRSYGVVGKIVEFFGPGLSSLSVADRATIGNMSPEYGATAGFFPVDGETLKYLAFTGRKVEQLDLVERYTKEQGIFRTDQTPQPEYNDVLELDLATVQPSLAGPKRPQDRIPLSTARKAWLEVVKTLRSSNGGEEKIRWEGEGGAPVVTAGVEEADVEASWAAGIPVVVSGRRDFLQHGSVVIAAITSCTNTSNPAVMLAAGILAKKAVKLGLQVPAYTKTSLAPGSRVVTRYLDDAGLTPYLEALGFHLVGYGCTTCIGNSGPLHPEVSRAVCEADLTVAAVLSGNRNFEGRIHPEVKANYLASPPLVVAYALAGTMDIDLQNDPIGLDRNEDPVYLRDIWPTNQEVDEAVAVHVSPQMFAQEYANVFTGNETWNAVKISESSRYKWDDISTYIRKPTFFEGLAEELPPLPDIRAARVLALLGDSVTTDHISPAGAIPEDSPAGKWLISQGVNVEDFNTYGSRRGNHEVMIRGTFGNIRIRNLLVPGVEGGYTRYLPTGEQMFIYEAAVKYQAEQTPLLVIAGKEYGSGSSRDWAAKGTILLGIKAVIAESFERIHRSNLIGMGVLPLQFKEGENAESHGLTGEEVYSLQSVDKPRQEIAVNVETERGAEKAFTVIVRLDTPVELDYYRNGGILHTVLRNMA